MFSYLTKIENWGTDVLYWQMNLTLYIYPAAQSCINNWWGRGGDESYYNIIDFWGMNAILYSTLPKFGEPSRPVSPGIAPMHIPPTHHSEA